ncbi:hypothetical protein DW228_06415 [Bacteroides fragilis]|uniref:Uncharacterized protein n=1 Tax=Bacteroides fragilis TaxID=817 RepID=A0A396C1J3_BACFG|nr:hypothetical protein [Bacteroides fragilis]RHH14431.1 hypothetical protein DW228_06415 [Bacteroides fragilis]
MRDFDIEEWKEHPELALVIEEYSPVNRKPTLWPVLNSSYVFDNYIVLQLDAEAIPYEIDEVILSDDRGAIYDKAKDLIGYLMFAPVARELWGITFQYENEDGFILRRLLESSPTFEFPYFNTQQEAFTWISTHDIRKYVNEDYVTEQCSKPQARLIDSWIE